MDVTAAPSAGTTTLLLAGPRAGKTSLLMRWKELAQEPAHHLKLSPEDAASPFFLRRFLAGWPDIRARFEHLRAEIAELGWGGLLGLAIAESHPAFTLLLDDFHLVEAMPERAEWLALVRHFPASGTLVLASRHLLDLDRAPLAVLGAEHPAWDERPVLADVLALPPELVAAAIALFVVGEAVPSQGPLELVRRCVASHAADGVIRLRDAWAPVVAEAIAAGSVAPEVWDTVEEELAAFKRRYLNLFQETLVPRILGRIPSEVRLASPLLTQAEGEIHVEHGRFEEARACFQRALSQARTPEEARGLKVRLFMTSLYVGDQPEREARAAELEAEAEALTPAQRAMYLLWRGIMHWDGAALPEAEGRFRAVLEVVAAGDREVHFHHARALALLGSKALRTSRFAEARGFDNRLFVLCRELRLERLHMTAIVNRLHVLVTDDSAQISLASLTELPNEAFRAPYPAAFNSYLVCFAWRASKLGVHRLARYLFHVAQAQAHMTNHPMGDAVRNGNIHLLYAHGRLGEFERARYYLEELGADPGSMRHLESARFIWAHVLVLGGRLDEAEQVLHQRQADPGQGELRSALYMAWIRHLRGDPRAVDDVRALLASAEGSAFWDHEAELLEQMGLRSRVQRFHVKVFGEPAFREAEGSPARWPRKKALTLLSLLALRPDGLPTEELVSILYPDIDRSEAGMALHRLAYDLRQALSGAGAPELLDSTRGFYRFKWDAVAFCDLHEFDGLYRKAQSLEADGLFESAAILYRMAMVVARPSLFEGLAEPVFEEPRRMHEARLAHAAAFSKAHAPFLDAMWVEA